MWTFFTLNTIQFYFSFYQCSTLLNIAYSSVAILANLKKQLCLLLYFFAFFIYLGIYLFA